MLSALGHAYGAAGDERSARDLLAKLNEMSLQRYVSSYEIALIHAAIGEFDCAFACLDRAFEERSGWLPYLNAEPRLGGLCNDPRFKSLVGRIGLQQNSRITGPDGTRIVFDCLRENSASS